MRIFLGHGAAKLWLVGEVCLQSTTFEMTPWSEASRPCREELKFFLLRPENRQLFCLFILKNLLTTYRRSQCQCVCSTNNFEGIGSLGGLEIG